MIPPFPIRSAPGGSPEVPFPYARVAQVRIARPTQQLARVVSFYRDGLGLPELERFEEHAGYSGVILGLPGHTYHLEFTQHASVSVTFAPSTDNLLVLYIRRESELRGLRERLERQGHAAVEPENPYWLDKSVTFADPDGWRVVLCACANPVSPPQRLVARYCGDQDDNGNRDRIPGTHEERTVIGARQCVQRGTYAGGDESRNGASKDWTERGATSESHQQTGRRGKR